MRCDVNGRFQGGSRLLRRVLAANLRSRRPTFGAVVLGPCLHLLAGGSSRADCPFALALAPVPYRTFAARRPGSTCERQLDCIHGSQLAQ